MPNSNPIIIKFRNRQESNPLASFSGLFHSKSKYILFLSMLHIMCLFCNVRNYKKNVLVFCSILLLFLTVCSTWTRYQVIAIYILDEESKKIFVYLYSTANVFTSYLIVVDSFYWWRESEYQEMTTDLSQVTDKISNNVGFTSPHCVRE